ncbi:MAG TPA: hypothetical protein VMR41_03615 [Patescibacteria group bacterium]|nr:hypothetical protein [Patescibacteria group bacterium]
MFKDLITSKSRIGLLEFFLKQPNEMFHVREIVRQTGDEINAIRRELLYLGKNGILTREPRANRVYFYLNKQYPFFYDLLVMGAKSIGLGNDVLANRVKLGKIKYAMFSGRFVRRMPASQEHVDFLIVGTIVLPELAILVRNEEARLNTEINYTAMTEEEFNFRKQRKDPFISGILAGSRVMIIGDEEALLA